jgi:nitroimidazol reductase NimA-like FMN-containing flavoprotein (pyridoxamine 5'-phosphate oxidase superfamily)
MGESPAPGVGWEQLTKSECFELLAGESLGRIAFVDERGPVVVPVNFVIDRHMVVIRTDQGAKLDMAGRGGRVAFEVDRVDAATRTGWSVLIRGEAIEVSDPQELERLRGLPLQPWAPGAKDHYMRILPATLSGRRIDAPVLGPGGHVRQPPRSGSPGAWG